MDAAFASRRSARRFALSSLILWLFVSASLPYLTAADPNAPCYNPSGAVALGYYPCDPTAYITNCCADGWTCFSNSLCVVTQDSDVFPDLQKGAVERSMCTNPEWNNQICGDFCVTGDDNADGAMVACGDNHFCCLGDYNAGLCNCSLASEDTGSSFVVNDGKAQTIVGATASFTGTVSYLTSQPPIPPTSSSYSTASSTSGTSTAATGRGTGTPSPTPKKSTHTLVMGLSIGLGAGVLLLAIAGFVYYWRGRHRRGYSGVGGGSHLRFNWESQPTDAAMDGTALREQMAMQDNAYRRGETGSSATELVDSNLGGQRLQLSEVDDVPPPPPQLRSNVG
ncbi:MAG: hypothetical protein STHCBS139747_001812 [Sporothrix thermara]